MFLMTITINQGLWKEGNKKKNYCENVCGHMAVKGRQQEKKNCESAYDQNSNKSHHILYLWQ
jgi:hypothetical protein